MGPSSLTDLIKDTGVSLNANAILSAIRKTDLVEEIEYESSSGTGEIKTFLRLTDRGLVYGINLDRHRDGKTEPRFLPEAFPRLLREIVDQLDREVRSLGV